VNQRFDLQIQTWYFTATDQRYRFVRDLTVEVREWIGDGCLLRSAEAAGCTRRNSPICLRTALIAPESLLPFKTQVRIFTQASSACSTPIVFGRILR
jgi:hypothetical protein